MSPRIFSYSYLSPLRTPMSSRISKPLGHPVEPSYTLGNIMRELQRMNHRLDAVEAHPRGSPSTHPRGPPSTPPRQDHSEEDENPFHQEEINEEVIHSQHHLSSAPNWPRTRSKPWMDSAISEPEPIWDAEPKWDGEPIWDTDDLIKLPGPTEDNGDLGMELEERMHDLKSELEGYNSDDSDESHKKEARDALKQMEKWNLFSDTPEEYKSYNVARDTFLSYLGATLLGSMRHVIAPSIVDGAYHYYDKISFQIYFITQETVRSIKKLPVNLKALMDGFSSLAVSFQKAMFSQHLLALSEDSELTMAFSIARRAAAVPLLLVNGTYRLTTRAYLDSSILQR